jgi:hypothetical protein
MAAHELVYDAHQKPEHRLTKLLERSEEELSSPRNQRKARQPVSACSFCLR